MASSTSWYTQSSRGGFSRRLCITDVYQLARPLLKDSGQGSIVFISSIAGSVGLINAAVYGAAKGAINQLAKNLACEWAKDNIRTNSVSVAPSPTETPMAAKYMVDEEMRRGVIARTPLRRTAEPEDVSSVVAFLCMGPLLILLAK
ncbi:hypothetical protein H6P81_008710 [Aristolochia fimbriata]|uniref:Uncharacterized protein n=1 Tax=Aristolochia fimbriata TaxID=158543 RepID=A0AAV7EIT0_ARIFI|nr:hypothetical protein H6P81_008710 [Aristolochia fimbriata]